ncbi:hypothetical protein ACWEJ6_23600 [Nonomuraea sp. NPDC004702]
MSTSQKCETPVRMVFTAPVSVEITHGRGCQVTMSASTPAPMVDIQPAAVSVRFRAGW